MAIAGVCRPCNDTELLMAICTSDFGERIPGLGRREGNTKWNAVGTG